MRFEKSSDDSPKVKFDEAIEANGNGGYIVGKDDGSKIIIDKFDNCVICQYDIKFGKCRFECDVNLSSNDSSTLFEYNKSLEFCNCDFKQAVDCRYVKTNGNIEFISTLFNDDEQTTGKTSFENTIFCGNGYKPFKEATFFSEADF